MRENNKGVDALTIRSFLIGAVSGGRSLTGLTAVALTTDPSALERPWARLAGPVGRSLLTIGAVGELVADKLPQVPSRLSPPSLVARAVAAATAAAFLAARRGAEPTRVLLPAVTGALAGSLAGARWRAFADRRRWPSVPAALLEDVVVVGIAVAAVQQE
jgi:uncharacterized membrane protein